MSSEDTPLSKRQMLSAGTKKKRLVLVDAGEASHDAEGETKHNSTEESHNEDANTRGQRKYSVGESEAEKQDESHDGVRRSQRAKRQIYVNYNDSWIFTERTVKVKCQKSASPDEKPNMIFDSFRGTLQSRKRATANKATAV